MSAKPTGRLAHREDGLYLMLDRLFTAPIDDVWASVSRSSGLSEWIGTYTGSPETGAVRFKLSDANAEWTYVSVLKCIPPKRFTVTVGEGAEARHLILHLVEGAGMTTLTFGQRLHSASEAASVGPYWDYYLDRLVAARTGQPLPERERYSPAHALYYSELIMPAKPKPSAPAATSPAAPTA
jgi:uncharacterized protein YndB with AHSA1/START domain